MVLVPLDEGLPPLACRDLAGKQDVNFAVGAIFHLRQEEECHHKTEAASAGPDIATLTSKVCAICFVNN